MESQIGRDLTIAGRPLRMIGILESVIGERVISVWVPFGLAETIMVPAPASRARTLHLNAAKVEDVLAVKAAAETWAGKRNPAWRTGNQVTVRQCGR